MKRPAPHEIVTIPNIISVAGFGLVTKGCLDSDPATSAGYIAAGRALDLVDGATARALDQESEFGAKLDAALDKLGMAAIIGSALYRNRMPKIAAGAVVAHNTLNAAASITAEIRHPDASAHPSSAGKIGLFLENVGVLSYLTASAIESHQANSQTARVLRSGGHILTACGVGLGMTAGIEYIQRARGKQPPAKE